MALDAGETACGWFIHEQRGVRAHEVAAARLSHLRFPALAPSAQLLGIETNIIDRSENHVPK